MNSAPESYAVHRGRLTIHLGPGARATTRGRRAFSMLEALLVVTVLGILIAAFAPRLDGTRSERRSQQALIKLQTGMELAAIHLTDADGWASWSPETEKTIAAEAIQWSTTATAPDTGPVDRLQIYERTDARVTLCASATGGVICVSRSGPRTYWGAASTLTDAAARARSLGDCTQERPQAVLATIRRASCA